MIYDPIYEILPRNHGNPAVTDLLAKFSLIIEEYVNFGTHFLGWCYDAKGGEEKIPLTLLLRHILELTDSISILIKNSSIDPCKTILRCILEAYISIEYMFRENTEKRALSFLVCNIRNNLSWASKIDPTTTRGQEFIKRLEKDDLFKGEFAPDLTKDTSEYRIKGEQLLKRPPYNEIEQEYQKVKKISKVNPTWYMLYDGPKTIEQLALGLGILSWYEVMYRSLSGHVHGLDIINEKINFKNNGEVGILQIRYPKDAQVITSYTLTLIIKTYLAFISKLIPEKQSTFQEWYQQNRDTYQKIMNEKLINEVKKEIC